MCLQLVDARHTGVFMSTAAHVNACAYDNPSERVCVHSTTAYVSARPCVHTCVSVRVYVCAPDEVLVPTALI